MLAYWKRKIPLGAILADTIDGRSISGGRQALKRLMDPKRKKPLEQRAKVQVGLLANYMSAVSVAQTFQAVNIPNLSDKDLAAGLSVLEHNGVVFPPDVQRALLSRRLGSISAATDLKNLLEVVNPFKTEKFCATAPTVSNLDMDSGHKLATFQQVVFQELMLDLISKGEPMAEKALELAQLAKDILEGVDLVALNDADAATVAESLSICDGVIGVATNTVDIYYQAASGRNP